MAKGLPLKKEVGHQIELEPRAESLVGVLYHMAPPNLEELHGHKEVSIEAVPEVLGRSKPSVVWVQTELPFILPPRENGM